MPEAPKVNLKLWAELYQAAAQFQALAPWTWMSDSEVLGINNTLGVRIMAVLGAIRQVFGLACYRGTDGTNALLLLRNPNLKPTTEFGYQLDAVMVDFVPKSHLETPDREIVKELAFKPGSVKPARYPQFRSYLPGYGPWFIDESEARQLVDNLNKTSTFAALLREHPDFFAGRNLNDVPFCSNDASDPLQPAQLTWHTIVLTPIARDAPVDPQSFNDLTSLSHLPQSTSMAWELDTFLTSARIMEPPRPYCPKMGLVADTNSGMILSLYGVDVKHTRSDAAATSLMVALRQHRQRPATILVRSEEFVRSLEPLTRALEIAIRRADHLPMIEMARKSIDEMLDRG